MRKSNIVVASSSSDALVVIILVLQFFALCARNSLLVTRRPCSLPVQIKVCPTTFFTGNLLKLLVLPVWFLSVANIEISHLGMLEWKKQCDCHSQDYHSNFVLVAQGLRSVQTTIELHLSDSLAQNSIIVVVSRVGDAHARNIAVLWFGISRNECNLLVAHGSCFLLTKTNFILPSHQHITNVIWRLCIKQLIQTTIKVKTTSCCTRNSNKEVALS